MCTLAAPDASKFGRIVQQGQVPFGDELKSAELGRIVLGRPLRLQTAGLDLPQTRHQ